MSFPRSVAPFGNRHGRRVEKVSSDNEQKFSINLMHVRFSKDELCVAKLLLSSPVYGWLNKQWDNLSLRVSAGERREQQANLM